MCTLLIANWRETSSGICLHIELHPNQCSFYLFWATCVSDQLTEGICALLVSEKLGNGHLVLLGPLASTLHRTACFSTCSVELCMMLLARTKMPSESVCNHTSSMNTMPWTGNVAAMLTLGKVSRHRKKDRTHRSEAVWVGMTS